jgi:hypothetical protein
LEIRELWPLTAEESMPARASRETNKESDGALETRIAQPPR